jgi:hypothetical protein
MLRRQFPAYSCLKRSSGFCGRRYLISHEEHRDRAADDALLLVNICGNVPLLLIFAPLAGSVTNFPDQAFPSASPAATSLRSSALATLAARKPALIRNRSCGRRIRGRRTVGSWRAQMWVHVMFPGEVNVPRHKVDGSNIWTHFCEQSAVSRKSLNAGRDRYRSWATRA